MNGSDEKGILRPALAEIFGTKTAVGDLDLAVRDEAARASRAVAFGDWLSSALGKIKGNVCFVDYAVFPDAKVAKPYFYVVSPTAHAKDRYVEAVTKLVKGTGNKKDCFSVAFHPEFVGIDDSPKAREAFAVIPLVSDNARPIEISSACGAAETEGKWATDFYPLWPTPEALWPPTSKQKLWETCGVHPLEECLAKFQKILKEARQYLCDSSGRPVTFVFCIPFPAASRGSSPSSTLPISEIAAELFLGVSYELSAEEATAEVLEFVRRLAMNTYREEAALAGKAEGLKNSIESFAHQIKGVANAMSTSWLVRLERWEEIRQLYLKDSADSGAAARIDAARVLPVPQLFDAIRDTLVLWSQTRRLYDLYIDWPLTFEDVVRRAWGLTNSARFTLGNKNRDFEVDLDELRAVWSQEDLMVPLVVKGNETSLGDGKTADLQAESWICHVTRLLAAIFDNSLEHGIRDENPEIGFHWDTPKQVVSLTISNMVDRVVTNPNSRLRIGMKGNDVLKFLADELNAQLTLPSPPPAPGHIYAVKVDIPLPIAFVQPKEVL